MIQALLGSAVSALVKWGLLIAVVILAAFRFYGWAQEGHQQAREASIRVQAMATQLEAAQNAQRASELALELSRRMAEERLQAQAQARREAETKLKELQDALKDHPDWAAGRVPDSVLDAIQGARQRPGPGAP